MRLPLVAAATLVATVSITGCGQQSLPRSAVLRHLPADDRSILAGKWEYEDGGTVALQLDAQGNGTYAYKDGRFETHQFGGGQWAGKWYQKENDREGGFHVKLSPDFTEGEGHWWYDRIGTDTKPSEKGGTFHLSRRTSVTSLSDTPPPP
ncbi:MAG: hypothetical protein MRJ66_11895 [Nitrospira sp.]|nr:hypothetical protein [Nitrospira sp.]